MFDRAMLSTTAFASAVLALLAPATGAAQQGPGATRFTHTDVSLNLPAGWIAPPMRPNAPPRSDRLLHVPWRSRPGLCESRGARG
jgi:hypothetical protein